MALYFAARTLSRQAAVAAASIRCSSWVSAPEALMVRIAPSMRSSAAPMSPTDSWTPRAARAMTALRRRPDACIWAVASGGSTWQLTVFASTVTTPISLSSAALSGCEDVPRRAPRVMAAGNDFEIGEGAVDGYLVVELRDLRAAASRGTLMGVTA